MSDHHEAGLLLAILREDWDRAGTIVGEAAPRPDVFVDLARTCDVYPWVHAVLERSARSDLVGAEAWESLSRMRHKCRNDNLLLLAHTEQVLDLLLEAGIVPVALKGLDFLHRFYDRFDERSMDDVDLLIPPRELSRALELLEGAGFKAPQGDERAHWLRSSYEMPLESPGPVKSLVEIHWGLAQEKRYEVAIEPVLERARPLEIAGRSIRRLDDYDAAAHLLLHHLQHYFDRRLKWMVEFRRISAQPGFDWHELARRFEMWGGRGAAGMSLVHLRKLFPDWIAPEALRALPAAPWRRALTLPLRSSHPLDLFRGTRSRKVQLYLAAAMIDRPWDLPGYLLHRATRDSRAGVTERGFKG